MCRLCVGARPLIVDQEPNLIWAELADPFEKKTKNLIAGFIVLSITAGKPAGWPSPGQAKSG